MAGLTAGVVGGLVATILMTVVMKASGGGAPPTAALVAKVADGPPEEHAAPGLALHLLYGTVAGAVLAVGAPLAGLDLVGSLAAAVGVGLAYGLALMIGGMVFWLRVVIGMEPKRTAMLRFAVVHAVYGLTFGAVLGAGVL